MISTYPDKNRDSFRDLLIDLGFDPNLQEQYWHILPESVKAKALQWGLSDTDFREQAYGFFEKYSN